VPTFNILVPVVNYLIKNKVSNERTDERTNEHTKWQRHFLSCSSQLKVECFLSLFGLLLSLTLKRMQFCDFFSILYFISNFIANAQFFSPRLFVILSLWLYSGYAWLYSKKMPCNSGLPQFAPLSHAVRINQLKHNIIVFKAYARFKNISYKFVVKFN
jgi:hypothetical protein